MFTYLVVAQLWCLLMAPLTLVHTIPIIHTSPGFVVPGFNSADRSFSPSNIPYSDPLSMAGPNYLPQQSAEIPYKPMDSSSGSFFYFNPTQYPSPSGYNGDWGVMQLPPAIPQFKSSPTSPSSPIQPYITTPGEASSYYNAQPTASEQFNGRPTNSQYREDANALSVADFSDQSRESNHSAVTHNPIWGTNTPFQGSPPTAHYAPFNNYAAQTAQFGATEDINKL